MSKSHRSENQKWEGVGKNIPGLWAKSDVVGVNSEGAGLGIAKILSSFQQVQESVAVMDEAQPQLSELAGCGIFELLACAAFLLFRFFH